MIYELTAKRYGATVSLMYGAQSDGEAMQEATRQILDRAVHSSIWAKGSIELRDEHGTLIANMDAKA
jgi:hypothetical protein